MQQPVFFVSLASLSFWLLLLKAYCTERAPLSSPWLAEPPHGRPQNLQSPCPARPAGRRPIPFGVGVVLANILPCTCRYVARMGSLASEWFSDVCPSVSMSNRSNGNPTTSSLGLLTLSAFSLIAPANTRRRLGQCSHNSRACAR